MGEHGLLHDLFVEAHSFHGSVSGGARRVPLRLARHFVDPEVSAVLLVQVHTPLGQRLECRALLLFRGCLKKKKSNEGFEGLERHNTYTQTNTHPVEEFETRKTFFCLIV